MYAGEWRGGVQTRGKQTELNGDVYEGDFGPSGKYQGRGRLACAEGVITSGEERGVYHGAWRDGMRHGHGRQTWPDGSTYYGKWQAGRQHGRGKWVAAPVMAGGDGAGSGDSAGGGDGEGGGVDKEGGGWHEGEWRDGMQHGRGKLMGAAGDMYSGQFAHGMPHGQGTWHELPLVSCPEAAVQGVITSKRRSFGLSAAISQAREMREAEGERSEGGAAAAAVEAARAAEEASARQQLAMGRRQQRRELAAGDQGEMIPGEGRSGPEARVWSTAGGEGEAGEEGEEGEEAEAEAEAGEEAEVGGDLAELHAAGALQLQARYRGHKAREEARQRGAVAHAAKMLQARQRGRLGRRHSAAMAEERQLLLLTTTDGEAGGGAAQRGGCKGGGGGGPGGGLVHMGSYAAGLRHGRGTLRYPDGSTCEATWVHGVAKGEGRLVDAGGSVYEGGLLEGVMFSGPRLGSGKASWISPLGVIASEGQGKMCFAPGEGGGGGVHEGGWGGGQPLGVGRRVFADGTVFEVSSTSGSK